MQKIRFKLLRKYKLNTCIFCLILQNGFLYILLIFNIQDLLILNIQSYFTYAANVYLKNLVILLTFLAKGINFIEK